MAHNSSGAFTVESTQQIRLVYFKVMNHFRPMGS